ncbi:hypothetical protein D3C87_1818340 [compost metagenome]
MRWDLVRGLTVPYPASDETREVLATINIAKEAEKVARQAFLQAKAVIEERLLLNTEDALSTLTAFKPPK